MRRCQSELRGKELPLSELEAKPLTIEELSEIKQCNLKSKIKPNIDCISLEGKYELLNDNGNESYNISNCPRKLNEILSGCVEFEGEIDNDVTSVNNVISGLLNVSCSSSSPLLPFNSPIELLLVVFFVESNASKQMIETIISFLNILKDKKIDLGKERIPKNYEEIIRIMDRCLPKLPVAKYDLCTYHCPLPRTQFYSNLEKRDKYKYIEKRNTLYYVSNKIPLILEFLSDEWHDNIPVIRKKPVLKLNTVINNYYDTNLAANIKLLNGCNYIIVQNKIGCNFFIQEDDIIQNISNNKYVYVHKIEWEDNLNTKLLLNDKTFNKQTVLDWTCQSPVVYITFSEFVCTEQNKYNWLNIRKREKAETFAKYDWVLLHFFDRNLIKDGLHNIALVPKPRLPDGVLQGYPYFYTNCFYDAHTDGTNRNISINSLITYTYKKNNNKTKLVNAFHTNDIPHTEVTKIMWDDYVELNDGMVIPVKLNKGTVNNIDLGTVKVFKQVGHITLDGGMANKVKNMRSANNLNEKQITSDHVFGSSKYTISWAGVIQKYDLIMNEIVRGKPINSFTSWGLLRNHKWILKIKNWYVLQSKYGSMFLKPFGICGNFEHWNYFISSLLTNCKPAMIDPITQVPLEPYHLWARIIKFYLKYLLKIYDTRIKRSTILYYAIYLEKLNGFNFKIKNNLNSIIIEHGDLPKHKRWSNFIPHGGAWYEQFSILLQLILLGTSHTLCGQHIIKNFWRLIQHLLLKPYTEKQYKLTLKNAKKVMKDSK